MGKRHCELHGVKYDGGVVLFYLLLHLFLKFVVDRESDLDQAVPVAVDRLGGRVGPEADARAWVSLSHVCWEPLGVTRDGETLADCAVDGCG